MINQEILPDLKRLANGGAFRSPMLMLGAQEVALAAYPPNGAALLFRELFGVASYTSLDLLDADLTLDLNDDLLAIADQYACVFNLGTLEHVWDVHAAWSNALRAVTAGGTFITHSPVGGWTDSIAGLFNHGLHMTRALAIEEFVTQNGFTLRDTWTSDFRQRGKILWLWAERTDGDMPMTMAEFKSVYRIRGMGRNYRAI